MVQVTRKKIIPNLTDSTILPDNIPPPSGKIDIETFGPVKIGQHYKDMVVAIGEPETKSSAQLWAADGMMHETWNYNSKGLSIALVSEETNASEKSIFSITAIKPSEYKTRANTGVGSSENEIKAAYLRDIDSSLSSAEQIVVGSVYGGIIFDLKNGKATKVFLGANAE